MGYSKTTDIKEESAAKKVAALVKKNCDIITSTMGPGGSVVLIQAAMGMMATKDGITVARHLAPRDSFERAIAQLIIDAANRTVNEVGDGTTTTACLIDTLYELWVDCHGSKTADLNEFLEGMDVAVKDVLDYLGSNAKSLLKQDGSINYDALRHVAMIASNGNQLVSGMVSDLIYEVGPKGRILMKKNLGNYTYTEKLSGYTFNTQILGRQHLRDSAGEITVLESPLFLVVIDPLESDKDIVPIVQTWLKSDELRMSDGKLRPLVIITLGLSGTARSYVAANAATHPIYVIQLPIGGQEGFDIVSDVKDITNMAHVYNISTGRPISSWGADFKETDLDKGEEWKEFGRAKSCILTSNSCSVVPIEEYEDAAHVATKIKLLEIKAAASKDEAEIEHTKKRIAALSSGVGIIYIGASSDAESARLAHSIDDTQRACFAALQAGVIPGAGRAYWKAMEYLSKEISNNPNNSFWQGYVLVLTSLASPAAKVFSNYRQINMFDAGKYVLVIQDDYLNEFWGGWNIKGEAIKDAYTSGIIDPLMVAQSALRNAVSVAKQFICAKYVLVEDVLPVVPGLSNPDDELDERIDKNSIKKLYQGLEHLRMNKENGTWDA